LIVLVAVRKLHLLRCSKKKEIINEYSQKISFFKKRIANGHRWNYKKIILTCLPLLFLSNLVFLNFTFDKIGEIIDYSQDYDSKQVIIVGKTNASISLPFVGSIYKISDGSGIVWVASRKDFTPSNRFFCIRAEVMPQLDINEIVPQSGKYAKYLTKVFSSNRIGPVLIEKERESVLSVFSFFKENSRSKMARLNAAIAAP